MYDLGRQRAQRLRMWREELPRHIFSPVTEIAFSYFVTKARYSAREAEGMPRRACPVGEPWGGMWEYAWFTGDAVLPEGCEGQRVVLFPGVGGEQLVYINGIAAGSVDKGHPYVTLTRNAAAGEKYHIQIEAYAGHGPRLETLGPCPPERRAVPPVDGPQCTVEKSVIAIWREDAYQLMLDVETLDKLQQVLPDNSLRALKVAEALDAFTRIADFELPPKEREASFRKAREALRPALQCKNGSTAPTMWTFGQSHIDLGWLWPVEETRHKAVRTYANQLRLMEEYPEYRFLLCEPALLDMLRAQDGEVWQRVRDAAKRGQIEPEGAFYVECDTNIPSGESLIRQLLYGKQWFREQFNAESRVAWQPDTFGFSAALPQILKKMGVPYFATEKLLRADPETERFPYQNFIWEGMDGSTVEALSFFKANAPVDPVAFHRRWDAERSQRENIDTMLYPFGFGDGGGGATRDMLEMRRRLEDLEGAPRAKWGSLAGFFEETARQGKNNRWAGELYLAWHRGTYSVQRRQKAAMRKLENTLREAEMLAGMLPEHERNEAACVLRTAWKTLMLNQFHDIAGGVGIQRVHREAEDALVQERERLLALCGKLRARVYGVSGSQGYTLFNSLPWERRAFIALPDGEEVYASLPPMGAVSAREAQLPPPGGLRAFVTENGFSVENQFFQAEIDGQGRIVGLIDKENGLSLLDNGMKMNEWRLYRNVQTVYDAWELDRNWENERIADGVASAASLTRLEETCVEITVAHTMSQSRASQVIRFRPGSRRIDFETDIDWREKRKMLKAHFESNVLSENAVHEIQFGCVRRPCHRSHPFAADRYEVSNQRYSALCEGDRGFALLNDGLYGLSSGRGELALTLLRSPLVPDETCDRGPHHFTYALFPFAGALWDAGAAKAGYELNAPVVLLPGECRRQAGFSCESRSVILETVKPAENGRGMVLRLYESAGLSSEAMISLPFDGKILACSMDEREDGESLGTGNRVSLRLKPFEIATLRVLPDRREA